MSPSTTRIAFVTHGGLDPPGEGVRIPFLAGLVDRLSRRYELHAFSLRRGSMMQLPARGHAAWREVVRAHQEFPFSLVHGIWAIPSGAFAVALAHHLGIPSVVSLHGAETASLPSIGYGHLRRQPHRSITLWTCRQAGAVLVLSRHQMEALRRAGIERDDITIVPPGPLPAFLSSEPKLPPSDTVHLLNVANLTEVKDHEMLLRAFARITRTREAILRLIGADYRSGFVQHMAGQLGIESRIEFAGFVPHENMVHHFRWADMFLQTSLHEAGGVAVAEAAAAHVPVCGTATGILHDLSPTAAVAVPPGDADALAHEVLALLKDPGRFADLQREAFAWAQAHTIDTTTTLIAETYERLLHD